MPLLFHPLFYINRLQIARGFDMARATSFLCQGNHTLLMQITGAAPAALFLLYDGHARVLW